MEAGAVMPGILSAIAYVATGLLSVGILCLRYNLGREIQ